VLLLGCHYDSKLCQGHPDPAHNFPFVAAIDGAGASGVLLELARVLNDHQTRARKGEGSLELITPNIWIVWFDGEECIEWDWTTEKSLLGSRHFARSMSNDKNLFPDGLAARLRVMVLLDLIGDKNIKIDKDTKSSAQLLEIFAAAAERMGETERMFEYESPMTDDHEPFKDFGVTVIDLIDFRWRAPEEWKMSAEEWQRRGITKPADGTYAAWWHTSEDTLDKMSPDSLAFAGNLVWHALTDIDEKFYAK
jgi:glutaminyl-peptide cyclotransferase